MANQTGEVDHEIAPLARTPHEVSIQHVALEGFDVAAPAVRSWTSRQ
jgi:hypothetical protein